MWFEAIGKVKETQPGKFVLGCTSATVLALAGTLMVGGLSSPAQAGLLDGLGVDVDVGHDGVDVDVDLGKASVDVDVGLDHDGLGVGLDVGLDDTGTRRAGPDVYVDENGVIRRVRGGGIVNAMPCAKDGNETAFNGFLVRDRDGTAFGWIHEATVSPNGKLVSIRLQSSDKSCYKLSNASFRIRGDEVWTNARAGSFR